MGWQDEQIRLRKLNDDQVFNESLMQAAGAVLSNRKAPIRDDRVVTGTVLEKILRYYHLNWQEIPEEIDSLEERMEYVMHPQGMMYRNVELTPGWHKNAAGAYLAFRKEDRSPVALIPSGLSGYRCYDASAGTSYRITSATEKKISRDAFCFYRPFPQTKLSIPLLAKYIIESLRLSDFISIALISFLAILVGMLIPRLTKLLFGAVLNTGNVSVLTAIAVFMVCASASRFIISTARDLITSRIETFLQMNIESAAMMRVLTLPPSFFHEYSSGEMSSRMQSINQLCSALVNAVLSTGLTSIFSLMYITQIFSFTPALVVPAIIIILLTVGFSTLTVLLETRRQKKVLEEDAKTTGLAFAIVSGIQKLRLAGAEKRGFSRWAAQYTKLAQLMYDPPLFLKVTGVISLAIDLFGTIALYSISISSSIAIDDYMAFNSAYAMVMGAFASLASLAIIFSRIKPVLNLAQPILDAQPETEGNRKVITELRGNIQLDDVTFRYEKNAPPIIKDLSMKIKKGEYVAVVGPSGCGKSTLMRLLLGFEKPETGGIFYDMKNIDQIDIKSLRRHIGCVMQDGGLFNDSIYANIALSAPTLTIEEAWEAAEAASIADDIRAMPMGMHTMISEGQGGISGGQKQRIMIARAIAPKPSVLIFDEATSALDNITQKKVTESLDALHCTRIVIAHRLSTIKSCDRILYMDHGKILEEGTYDELMEKNGLFADMVSRQQV